MNIADIPMVEPSAQGRIAFARMKSGYYPSDATNDIYTINANGTNLRQITKGAKAYEFWFSPDGTQIAYIRRIWHGFGDQATHNFQLCVMSADGTNVKNLETVGDISTAGWLPDGKRLFYATSVTWPEKIAYVIDPDGGEQRLLAPDDLPEPLSPLWTPSEYRYIEHRVLSPDGTKVALLAFDQHGQGNLDISDAQTGIDLQVEYARNEYNPMIPSWSPNGEEIAFVALGEDSIWDRQNPEALHIMNISSGTIRKVIDVDFGRITRHEVYPYAPVWSPDGSWIAFIGLYDTDGVSDDIYLVNPDGSNLRRVTIDGLPKCNLVWQPGS